MAYCAHCGTQISEMAAACPQCGHPTARGGAVGRTEGTATASLVLGIAGLVACPLVCSILAVVFGGQAKRRIAEDPTLQGEGMANAGVILGWIGIALGILGIFVWLAAYSAVSHY